MSRLLPLLLLCACAVERPALDEPAWDPPDDPALYVAEDPAYRRAVLERDLTDRDNGYARARLQRYGLGGSGWDALPERDPPTLPLDDAAVLAFFEQRDPPFDDAEARALSPASLPETEQGWVELGERVFFEYPLRADTTYEGVLRVEDALPSSGFLRHDDGTWVGLRLFRQDGAVRVGPTCAQCHASRIDGGPLSGVLANRRMDVGRLRLLALGFTPGDLPAEIDSTAVGELDRLGPGRSDLLADNVFNPYAFPDFGGIADLPYLHHTANWRHAGSATLAVRCETLFITSNSERTRIPRVLSWALAAYLRSLPPPPPLDPEPAPEAARGEELFEEAGCSDCHAPPLFTSDREVSVEEIGTDPAAGLSGARGTGLYRIPSLRGVGRTAPYLHHGAFEDLEAMFEPGREDDEPGHLYGLELDEGEREALLAFLRSI